MCHRLGTDMCTPIDDFLMLLENFNVLEMPLTVDEFDGFTRQCHLPFGLLSFVFELGPYTHRLNNPECLSCQGGRAGSEQSCVFLQ